MDHERRRSHRLRAYQPVRLRKPGAATLIETLAKDVSSTGLRCLSQVEFPVATELIIELLLSSGYAPFTARGKMIWFQAIPQSEQFDIGIEFVDVSQENQRRLSVYLDRLSRQAIPA